MPTTQQRLYKAIFRHTPARWAVILGALALALIGLTILNQLPQGRHFLTRQALFLAAAIPVMLLIAQTNYLKIGRAAYGLFAITLVLLAALLVAKYTGLAGPLVPKIRGAARWINLGIVKIQPSEFVKITYILALAYYLRYRRNYRRFLGLIGPAAFTLLPMALIILEPDLGTVMLLLPVLFIMLIAAGAKIRHLAAVVGIMILASPALLYIMADYQRGRITGLFLQSPAFRTWLKDHPRAKAFAYPGRSLSTWKREQGYHLHHAKIAIATGRVYGYTPPHDDPYTNGTYHLPDSHNDFIFAMIAHRLGLVGAAATIALYIVMFTGLIEIAGTVTEPFGRLITIGAFAMILTQATINIAMTVGLMPITGVTLPFVSYGGSSLLTSFILAGLALAVDRTRPITIAPRPFEFAKETP